VHRIAFVFVLFKFLRNAQLLKKIKRNILPPIVRIFVWSIFASLVYHCIVSLCIKLHLLAAVSIICIQARVAFLIRFMFSEQTNNNLIRQNIIKIIKI